jgi:hypothetical protein
MNTMLQKALITLREDLSLQIAVAESSHDVELSPRDALGLAQALLAKSAALKPWEARPDSDAIHGALEVGILALALAHHLEQRAPLPENVLHEVRVLVKDGREAMAWLLTALEARNDAGKN